MKSRYIKQLDLLFNLFELSIVLGVLVLALMMQFFFHDLPCPLCLLQRVGFFGIIFGFLLNLKYGFKPSHYAIVLISAFYTSFVALRQIALHVIPGTGSFGEAVFGLHLYTWSYIISISIAILTSFALSVDRKYLLPTKVPPIWRQLTNVVFIAVIIVLSVNLISVFFECGLQPCPDNPKSYQLLSRGF